MSKIIEEYKMNNTYNFLNFCENYRYINNKNEIITNCNSIFYNMELVISNNRLSFLIDPNDFLKSQDYTNIIK